MFISLLTLKHLYRLNSTRKNKHGNIIKAIMFVLFEFDKSIFVIEKYKANYMLCLFLILNILNFIKYG